MADTVKRVEKPWGYEIHWAHTDRYVGKILHINAGHALSLQYHLKKDETIYVHSGRLRYEIERDGTMVTMREAAPLLSISPGISRAARNSATR